MLLDGDASYILGADGDSMLIRQEVAQVDLEVLLKLLHEFLLLKAPCLMVMSMAHSDLHVT